MFPIHLTSYPAWQKYLFSWHHKLKDISDIIPQYFSKTYSLHHRRSKNNGFLNQKTKGVLRIQIYLLYKQLAQFTDAEQLQASATYGSQTTIPW